MITISATLLVAFMSATLSLLTTLFLAQHLLPLNNNKCHKKIEILTTLSFGYISAATLEPNLEYTMARLHFKQKLEIMLPKNKKR